MASSMSKTALCTTCSKGAGLFTCRGCEKDFCTRHVVEHRQELGKQMDELTFLHDEFRQNLDEQIAECQQQSAIKQIDQWEQGWTEKIRSIAADAREQLRHIISEHTGKLNETMNKIATELRRARVEDDFFETDLQNWTEKLDRLKKETAQPMNVSIQQEGENMIPKIAILTSAREHFERSTENIQIEENNQVIAKDQCQGDASVRGNGEYDKGQHRFRFKIEEYHPSKWLFIGIASKGMALQANSHRDQSVYGWDGSNQVYLDGTQHDNFNGYISDMGKDDIVELVLDCDQQMIRLTNERTDQRHAIPVDADKCPYPWQLNFQLYWGKDRIRILQT